MREKKYVEARAVFDEAAAKDGRSIPALEGAAATAFVLNDLERSAILYKKISMLDVRRAEPLINLGAVFNRQRDYDGAARVLRQAIAKNRKSADAYYNLGIAYKGLNQHTQAISAYKESLRVDPKMAEAHQNLGNLYLEQGNVPQAIGHFEKALALRPGFEKARRCLERAQQAKDDAKRSQQPFGRLVREEEMALRKERRAFRKLSEQERFEDRQTLHQLAKEAEVLTAAVITQLQDELSPAILRLQQISAQGAEVRALYREAQNAAAFAARFTAVVEALHSKVESIRQHEAVVRGPAEPDSPAVEAASGAP